MAAGEATSDGVPLPALAWRGMAVVCALLAVVLLFASSRYGYHRDELYFIACGQHLAWSYPDQGMLTPLLAATFDALGHGSLVVFRLPAVASVVGAAWLTGLTARELGGRTRAQVLATLTVAVSTVGLLAGHLLATATLDFVVWVAITWVVLRIARTGQTRLWVVAGVLVGLGLLNKDLVLVLVLSLTLGMLTAPGGRSSGPQPLVRRRCGDRRSRLGSRAPLAGAARLAAGHPRPDDPRRVRHCRPAHRVPRAPDRPVQPGRLGALDHRRGARVARPSVALRPRSRGVLAGRAHRLRVTAGQAYYTVGVYPALIAAGAVVLERRPRLFWAMTAVVAVTSAVADAGLAADPAAAAPWPHPAGQAPPSNSWRCSAGPARSASSPRPTGASPPQRRAHAVILTANYGEAGAVDRYRGRFGLPAAYSGLNAFGLWGPPPASGRPVVLVWEDARPPTYLRGCRFVRRVGGPVPNEEHDYARIFVCAGPRGTWASIWPRVAHLSN